ncbi:hypothetical protein Tco_0488859 [Tanacetum coccineum]
MGSNEEIRRLAQEAEKQQLFAQKVQQQNTNLTSQLEMYKERVRILEGINKDNNYLNEFLEADERAKRYNKQAQSQFVRDRDIIRDLEKQRDKLELDVKDYKRQKEEYQKTQTIFNQTQRNKEEKYLDDILQLQAKIKDLENVVCKMGKSTETLRLLTNEQKAFRDNLHKSGLGYNGPYVLSQAYAKIPKLYRAYELCDKNKQLHVFDSEETLEDAEKSQLKMNEFQKDEKVQELKIQPIDYGKLNKLYDNFVPQKDLSAEQTYFPSSCISSVSKISSEEFSSKTKPSMASMPSANPMLVDLNEMENIFQTLFKLIQKICKRDEKEMNPIVQKLYFYFILFQNRFKKDVKLSDQFQKDIKEMKDVFESTESELNELEKQNELLKDQLLEASLAEDIKNLIKTLIDELEKVLTQQTKDLNAVKLELSNRTAKFEAYFEKKKVVLERQLARKVDDSKAEKDQFLNKINHLRNQLKNLKGKSVETKFDKSLILEKPPSDKHLINSQISKSCFITKIVVQKDLSKPVTAQSLPKNEKDQFLKRIASLESKLASQDIHSCQKEYHELRTSYNALKVKFDALNQK